jgi:hypothetical protein
MTAAGFTEITHFYRPPGLPQAEQPWLASLWRKPDSNSAHVNINSN